MRGVPRSGSNAATPSSAAAKVSAVSGHLGVARDRPEAGAALADDSMGMRERECGAILVGIVGGGIGGLTAALSLLRRGFEVQVYEQASALGEIGAGVQISPNASRLAGELASTGVRPLAWHQRRWDDGRTLLRTPLAEPLEAAFGFPHYQMHRANLLTALTRSFPAESVRLGHRLTGLTDHGDRVEAQFANGARVDVDVLLGADGIHSPVRHLLFGPESPRFTGCVAYRGWCRPSGCAGSGSR
jgi:salicylate hydroxylase